jgi:eukaryotic-like serine/threonine-protein kinase
MTSSHKPRLTDARRAILDRQLDELLELESDEREARLAEFGRRYRRLHRWLARLVEASAAPTRFLNEAVSRTARRAVAEHADEPVALPMGTRLGPWRIIAPAGHGGMGVVYQAERADGAFEMLAAIKLIKSSKDGLSRRLMRERQLLARLDHAGISRLIDGGMTEDGQAYLVMEWVAGDDLTNDLRSDLDGLSVFRQIAEAVIHAHQRMIIHGDIKPGNVRIMADGRARLLDFGVARLMADEDDEDIDQALALTPNYAAPELLAGQPASAQSDTWAMGTLLAWLLSGHHPPPNARIEAAQIDHARARELAAIINHARAEDPAERYESVAELKDEIVRIQTQRPTERVPASPWQRLGLWGQRNPVAAALAAMMCVSLLVGASLLAWQARIVTVERDLARFENTRWEIMRDHLVTLFQEVAVEAGDDALSARALLDGTAGMLDRFMDDDPVGKAHIKSMLGSLYIALQDYQAAGDILNRFVAADDGATTPALRSGAYVNLAQAEERLGDLARALTMADQALEIITPLPGDHRRRLSEIYQVRGRILRSMGQWDAAIANLETALELARSMSSAPHRTLGFAKNNLGVTLLYAGQSEGAMRILSDSLQVWRDLGLDESNDALNVMGNLASLKHQQGQLIEAETLYGQVIDMRRQRFGESAALAALQNNYGLLLILRNRPKSAREQLLGALQMQARFVGSESPDFALTLRSKGLLHMLTDEMDLAGERFEQAEAIMQARVGPDHLFTKLIQAHQAYLLRHTDPLAARRAFTEIMTDLEQLGPPAEVHLAAALCENAVLELDLGNPASAYDAASACVDIRQRRLMSDSWQTSEAQALQAIALHRLELTQPGQHLDMLILTLANSYGPGHPRLVWLNQQLERLLD